MNVRHSSLSGSLVVAVGLVLTSCGSGAPQALPLAGRGASTAEDAAGQGAMAPDMLWAPTTYEAGPGMPALGGNRTVFRIRPGTDDDLLRVAAALGISGEIIREGSSRRIPAGDGAVESFEDAWFSYWSGRASGSGVAVACGSDGVCEDAPPPERPAGLPTGDEARAQAMAVLGSAGLSLEGAQVTVDDGITAWYVTVQYRVDGMLVDGLTGYATVDEGGISNISGPLGTLEAVGTYPTISTIDAIERLNEGWGPMPMMEGGPAVDLGVPDVDQPQPADVPAKESTTRPETVVEPAKPVPPIAPADPGSTFPVAPDAPRPERITEAPYQEPLVLVAAVTDAEWGLTTFWSWDGSGIYLLPAYRYTVEGQDWQPVVAAVTDEIIAPPPVESERPDEVVVPSEGSDGRTSGSSGSAP